MQCIIQDGRVVMAFSDAADLSQWPFVVDSGQASNIYGIDGPFAVVHADIPMSTPSSDLAYDGVNVTVIPPPMPSEADYDKALEKMYDAKAREKNYDNRYTCALRAGYPSAFQPEGAAFGTWMDNCNALAYQVMAEVLSGQRAQPTISEFLAMMPAMVWP